MYQTLYRKYRPIRFRDIVGQDPIVKALKNALKQKRLAHAYLFAGQRGTGKTTTARVLAMALNCENLTAEEPCGECGPCESIIKGSAVDILELDAASHTGVDAVREAIVDRLAFVPALLRFKVYIIDEVHMLSASSFAALLKSLEEPPPRVVFVLATTDPHKVPATVRSRCLRFDFQPVTPSAIVQRMRQVLDGEGWQGYCDPEALQLIATTAKGSVRDALTLLEQIISFSDGTITVDLVHSLLGMTDRDFLCSLLDALREKDRVRIWQWVQESVDRGRDLHQLVRDLSAYLRRLLSCKLGAQTEADETKILEQANQWSEEDLIVLLRSIWELEREMRLSEDPQLTLEVGLLQMIRHQRQVDHARQPESVEEPVIATETKKVPLIQSGATDQGESTKALTSAQVQQKEKKAEESPASILWQKYLQELKNKSLIAYSFYVHAEPIGVSGDCLIIAFRHPFHYDRASDPKYLGLAEEVAARVYESVRRIRTQLKESVGEPIVGTAVKPPTTSEKTLRPTEELLRDLFEE
ncbi:MAG: DNA polymerase III subunit gamma/tau [Armatimonadetes bacterium]|nr:DNA polymerase III subunit gamma/tau [Armatimonadota bacterium]MDW8121842.1 DNA polymerase III subunit gamma/tau [Armatimonadota bacterium]